MGIHSCIYGNRRYNSGAVPVHAIYQIQKNAATPDYGKGLFGGYIDLRDLWYIFISDFQSEFDLRNGIVLLVGFLVGLSLSGLHFS